MKVIIIKDCKDGKKDEMIEVSDGYAKNFLIKKGFAVAVNRATKNNQEKSLEAKKDVKEKLLANAQKIKNILEDIELSFTLGVTNMVVHGSVTRKQIHNELIAKGIKVDSHSIENKKINSLGISKIKVKLYKNIIAILKVKVSEDEK